ncbi:MAG: glycosyltransferase, partial [Holophagales bacterium]|nr:glycosyltransferase [Holophagales bacterium]
MKIAVLTAGSRGDIDPFLALSLALQAAGHEVSVWVPAMFQARVRRWGLRCAAAASDAERFDAIQPSKENALAMLEDDGKRALYQTMESTWAACQGVDAIVYHATMVSGPQIAEKLEVPCFAVVQPPILTPTRAFPCPLAGVRCGSPEQNLRSYREVFARLSAPVAEMVDLWRRERLGLAPRPQGCHPFLVSRGRPNPVMYCCSPLLFPRPDDWPENVVATGFWLLPASVTWNPPPQLVDFLAAGEPPVYVGFGSMDGGDPREMGRMVVRALARAGQRGILATGWGGMAFDSEQPEPF